MKFIQSLLTAVVCLIGLNSFADKLENLKKSSLNNQAIEKDRSPTTNGRACRSL